MKQEAYDADGYPMNIRETRSGKHSLIHRTETFAGRVFIPDHAIRINHEPLTIIHF
ncbi:MAG: hypothetical protein ABIJ53_04195 [Verrucomicrobiota bacterium]